MLIALGLVLTLNRLTLLLALGGAAVTVLYPFTKRFLSTPQFVLGVAFAWGVPMAFAATQGDVPRLGWLLFLSAVIWVVVYDTQYAMTDRVDDLKVGIRSTAILFGDLDRPFIAGLQLLLLASLVLVGHSAQLGAWYYGGLGAAAAFGRVSDLSDQGPRRRPVLPRVPEQRVGGRRRVLRHRARLPVPRLTRRFRRARGGDRRCSAPRRRRVAPRPAR